MQKILLYINGEFTTASPMIIDNRVYVPVKLIAEALGAETKWDEEEQAVRIDSDIKLVASVPEEKIYLYALNEEEDKQILAKMYKGLILSINGKKQVFDWKTISAISDLPQLNYVDLNGENKKRMAIILSRERGTGIMHQTIHIINPENFMEYKVKNPLAIIKDNVETQIISDREVKVKINGNVINVNLDNLPKAMSGSYPKTISNIYYENYTGYQITNNILRARVGVEVGPTKYIGFITIDYSFQGGEFKANKILFEKYPSNF